MTFRFRLASLPNTNTMASTCVRSPPINTPFLLRSSSHHSITSLSHPIRFSYPDYLPLSGASISVSLYNLGSRKRNRNRLFCSFSSFVGNFLESDAMTIKTAVRISERRLLVKGNPVLEDVPDMVTLTPGTEGVFLGAVLEKESNRHVIPIGRLRDVRFLACFRFKLWWMAQRMGTCANEIPLETQFLLFETNEADGSVLYTLFLPLIESPFRACLQGSQSNFLELCLESGDEAVKAASFTHAVLVHCGKDPFAVITEAVASAQSHLKTFRTRHEKRLPAIVDLFGWCTWDAFYQEVTQEGVEEGIASLAAGGTPAKFLIIDDGWQSVKEHQKAMRLTGIKENEKFQDRNDRTSGIGGVVKAVKEKHGVEQVYVWHAITGYWGGVDPHANGYDSTVRYPAISSGVVENEPTWKTDPLALNGLGLVNPSNALKFFNDVHGYLSNSGVDGVKVDVQSIIETLGEGLGGRVELTKKFHHALDASVARNFPTNGIIACMSHSSDALLCSRQTAVVRASDDFYPRDPMSHTIHIASVAYNSVFLGEFMLPDWDMFHSLHPAAEYHASARAISGGPVYVSDAPGKHDFNILRKLVLPDGSILRARLPGRPTLDCLFCDPARDGVSLLKIWNLNKYTGVVGVYNCQGAAWCSTAKKNAFHQTTTASITGTLKARDVHLIGETTDDAQWGGDCAVYSHHRRDVVFLPHNSVIPVSLKVLEHEIYTLTPVKQISDDISFAPFGLIEMYNSGGAIVGLTYSQTVVTMEVKGSGKFGAYSSVKPSACSVHDSTVQFDYDPYSGLVSFVLDDRSFHDVKFYW